MDYRDAIQRDAETGAAQLFAAHGAMLWNTALKMCRNAADAEDLTLRTIEHAVDKIGQYNPAQPIFPWLCGILTNLYRMDLRGKGRNALDFMAELPDCSDVRPDPAEVLSRESDAHAVHAAMDEIPEQCKILLVLRYFDELTVPQIASCLGIPEGSVKRRIHEAKAALRNRLLRTVGGKEA